MVDFIFNSILIHYLLFTTSTRLPLAYSRHGLTGVDWYLEPKAHRGSAQRLPHKILSTHLTMRIPLLPRTQEERDSRVVARKNEVVVK
jgi:hypothetical protein